MHLFLSPHSDDIAYSLGGTILKHHINEGMLVSVFQRSSNIPNINPKASIEEGSAIRFKEDSTYAQSIGFTYQSLHLPEAMDRGYKDFDLICQADNYITDPDRVEYEHVIQSFLERQSITTLWAPLAIGLHIDHLVVHKAALNWKPKKKPKIIFYEELPYAAYWSQTRLNQWIMQSVGPAESELIDITAVFEQKMRHVRIYQSQLNARDTAGIRQHGLGLMNGLAVERIWYKTGEAS